MSGIDPDGVDLTVAGAAGIGAGVIAALLHRRGEIGRGLRQRVGPGSQAADRSEKRHRDTNGQQDWGAKRFSAQDSHGDLRRSASTWIVIGQTGTEEYLRSSLICDFHHEWCSRYAA